MEPETTEVTERAGRANEKKLADVHLASARAKFAVAGQVKVIESLLPLFSPLRLKTVWTLELNSAPWLSFSASLRLAQDFLSASIPPALHSVVANRVHPW